MALAAATHLDRASRHDGRGQVIDRATARRSSISLSSMSTKIELAVGDTTINEEFGAGRPLMSA
jgi:hypothetical protein